MSAKTCTAKVTHQHQYGEQTHNNVDVFRDEIGYSCYLYGPTFRTYLNVVPGCLVDGNGVPQHFTVCSETRPRRPLAYHVEVSQATAANWVLVGQFATEDEAEKFQAGLEGHWAEAGVSTVSRIVLK